MILAEADLTPEARVLTVPVATQALQVLLLHDLTAGLVLELVILTQELKAEAAGKAPAPVFPDTPLTLDTLGILESAGTGVALEALPAVAHPGLAEVTDGPHHLHPNGVGAGMLDDAVSALHHALLLTALCAHWQSLHGQAEVAEGPVLLPPGALVALHGEVAGPLGDVEVHLPLAALPDLLLPLPHRVVLLPLARLLLWHLGA